MTAFLKAQGVWTIVTGNETIPVMHTQTTVALALEIQREQCIWTNHNHQAEGYILLQLSLQVLQTVTGHDTAKEAWDQLTKVFGIVGPSQIFADFCKAITYRV